MLDTCWKLNLLRINSIYLVVSSFKSKEDSYWPKYTSSFLLCPNRNNSKAFKRSNWIKLILQCVCYRWNLLWWVSFMPCDKWETLIFLKACRYNEIFPTAILSYSLKDAFWKKFVFYFISTIKQYDANTKVPKCRSHTILLLDKLL